MSFFKSLLTMVKWLAIAAVILLAVLAFRAFNFNPDLSQVDKIASLPIDYPAAAERLAGALRFKTVSPQDPKDRDTQAFLDFQQYLEKTFPLVHQNLIRTKINKLSLLYHWKADSKKTGSNKAKLKPVVLMGHYDVVPVDPSTFNDWSFPPFDGVVSKEAIWGRGALDDKGSVLAILEAAEYALSKGFTPARDIYFAFGHDEEIGGNQGAVKIVEYLKQHKIKLDYVIDEGGFVTEGMLPGVNAPLAVIGVAEKGYVSAKLSVQAEGGHSSAPPKNTSIGILSQAIVNLEKHPFSARLVNTTEKMLTTIGRHSSFSKKLVFANLWLFKPFLLDQLSQSKMTNATIRTTTAVTVIRAGDKENALPINASAIVNLRLLPGDSLKIVENHLRKAIDDPRVKLEIMTGAEASPVSSTTSEAYQQLTKVIDQVSLEQGVVIVPNLMIGGTDSKHFIDIADNVYRFNGVKITPESFSGFHGTNEYLPLKEYQRAINFYYQLIQLNQ